MWSVFVLCACVVGAVHEGFWHPQDFILWLFGSFFFPCRAWGTSPMTETHGVQGNFWARLCCSALIKCRGNRQWDLRAQSFIPADWLMGKKVPEPLLLLKGLPCLTAVKLRALLPSALSMPTGGQSSSTKMGARLALGESGLILSAGHWDTTSKLPGWEEMRLSRDPLMS